MANKNNRSSLVAGAVIASVLGTLTSLLLPKKASKNWADQAKDIAVNWRAPKENRRNLVLGGVAGGLVGVATALLLAPKSGSDLIKDLSKSFKSNVSRHLASSHLSIHKPAKKKQAVIKHRAAASSQVNHKNSPVKSKSPYPHSPAKRTPIKKGKASNSTASHRR